MLISGVRTHIWSEFIRLHKNCIEAPLHLLKKHQAYKSKLRAKLAQRKALRPVPAALVAAKNPFPIRSLSTSFKLTFHSLRRYQKSELKATVNLYPDLCDFLAATIFHRVVWVDHQLLLLLLWDLLVREILTISKEYLRLDELHRENVSGI
jgi:hypothetical protein